MNGVNTTDINSNNLNNKVADIMLTTNSDGYFTFIINGLFIIVGIAPIVVMFWGLVNFQIYVNTGNARAKDVAGLMGTLGGLSTPMSLLGINQIKKSSQGN